MGLLHTDHLIQYRVEGERNPYKTRAGTETYFPC